MRSSVLRTWAVAALKLLLEPKPATEKKALRQLPLLERKPNAGLVSFYDGLLELLNCGTARWTVSPLTSSSDVTHLLEAVYGSSAIPCSSREPGSRWRKNPSS
jgi:hypothetical protein